jgi:hypothetical protein
VSPCPTFPFSFFYSQFHSRTKRRQGGAFKSKVLPIWPELSSCSMGSYICDLWGSQFLDTVSLSKQSPHGERLTGRQSDQRHFWVQLLLSHGYEAVVNLGSGWCPEGVHVG